MQPQIFSGRGQAFTPVAASNCNSAGSFNFALDDALSVLNEYHHSQSSTAVITARSTTP